MARLLVNAEHVDDVTQAVALKLQSVDTLSRMRAARSPEGYAFMMVRNAGIDFQRRHPHQPISLLTDGDDAADPAPGQDEVLEQRVRSGALKAVLDDLADSEQLLLRLRFWDNLSIAEIAARLEMPYSTVAVRMFRLLRRLRSRLEWRG
jgi:RNA polymerase sigma-70 factor (ECF subfamily)